jgi:uncharacterized protein
MGQRYARTMFTPSVQGEQQRHGSRRMFARMAEEGPDDSQLGPDELNFIATRTHFYMASVSETGWPYMQHRGGPMGFLTALDPATLAFADMSGNRQYVSAGHLRQNDRVTLFLIDYGMRARLKLLGHARIVTAEDDPTLADRLAPHPDLRKRVEHSIIVTLAGYEWNCSKFITPRFTVTEVDHAVKSLHGRIAELEAEVTRLRGGED